MSGDHYHCECCGWPVSAMAFQLGRQHKHEPAYRIVILNGHERHWVKERSA